MFLAYWQVRYLEVIKMMLINKVFVFPFVLDDIIIIMTKENQTF